MDCEYGDECHLDCALLYIFTHIHIPKKKKDCEYGDECYLDYAFQPSGNLLQGPPK